jgi:hypothetical protein
MDGWIDSWIDSWMVCGQETLSSHVLLSTSTPCSMDGWMDGLIHGWFAYRKHFFPTTFFFVEIFCHLVTHKKQEGRSCYFYKGFFGEKKFPPHSPYFEQKKKVENFILRPWVLTCRQYIARFLFKLYFFLFDL